MVYVDGAEYGRLPFAKRHIEAGVHRFEVRAEGHLPETRTLNVAGKVDHVELATVALKPLAPVAGHGAPARRRARYRSPWDWGLGGAIAAVGAVHLIAGAYQKAKSGDCVDDRRPCTEFYESHPTRENLLIGLGSAGLALGAAVIGFAPIGQLELRSGADHALLQFKGEF